MSLPTPAPRLRGVLETAVYVTDLERSRDFYSRHLGLSVMTGDDRFCAFDVGGRDVFLLFRKRATLEMVQTPGGGIPPHDGDGQLHFAFAIAAEDLASWEQRLRSAGVEIESRVACARGGHSLYFRDPDGHLVELATPGLWANY